VDIFSPALFEKDELWFQGNIFFPGDINSEEPWIPNSEGHKKREIKLQYLFKL